MLISKILQEMIGNAQGEFESQTVLLPFDTATALRDLSAKMGVPASRLHAELLAAALLEADTEWRRLTVGQYPKPSSPEAPVLSLRMPAHVK